MFAPYLSKYSVPAGRVRVRRTITLVEFNQLVDATESGPDRQGRLARSEASFTEQRSRQRFAVNISAV